MTKCEAVMAWLAACPQVQQLYFQFGADDADSITLTATEQTRRAYIDGSKSIRYTCELIWYMPASVDGDATNMDAMLDIEAFNAWLEQQDIAMQYPIFPEGCSVDAVYPLESNIGYVALQDGTKAKYIVPFAIDYTKGV